MTGFAPILAFAFLAPWLMAAGAAATSIPIIIHLLNKRKFKVVVWAAMEWLLAAQRRNARRLKFQRWLLLALRCLAILLISAGIAQLVLQNAALGSLLGEQRTIVILLDDSYSMGYQQDQAATAAGGGGTTFDRSRRLLIDYVKSLRSGDEVALIRASSTGMADAANVKPTPDHQAILTQLNAARVTDSATDLPAAFDRAKEILTSVENKSRSRQLLLITDFTNSSVHDPKRGNGAGADNRIEGLNGEKLKNAVAGAAAHATAFHMIDMGTETQTNMAVTGLSTRRPAVVAGVPSDLQVEVFNASDRPQMDVNVSLEVDGVPQQQGVKIPKIEPGSFQTVPATVLIPAIGRHLVEAKLSPDLLPLDDTRRLMLNVRKEIPVLLVDGSPGDGGKTSYGSTFYLNAVYAVSSPGKNTSLFAPKLISELELATTPLANYDIIVLSDTSDTSPQLRDNLKTFVQNGGLLIIYPGPRTAASAQRFNEAFGENGAKLLPATLGQQVKTAEGEEGATFDPEGFQKNPIMQIFGAAEREGKEVGFKTVQTSQYLKLGVPADGSSEVVLRYAKKGAESTGDAAVVIKRGIAAPNSGNLGGNVILFASTADMSWNSWGAKPSYLPFMLELTFYGMPRATLNNGSNLTLDVNQPIALPGDASIPGPWIGPRDTRIAVSQELKDGKAALASSPLTVAGSYYPANGDLRPVIAVNPETREADIRHVSSASMASSLGVETSAVIPASALVELRTAGNENPISWLGPTLIAAALIVFVAEAMLALAFSTYR